jgi:hypothetical protein
MSEKSERRSLNRIEIPSAEIFYKPKKRLNILTILIGPTDLINISKSGACFISKNPINKGSDVLLKIVLPIKDPIILKANTVWTSANHEPGQMLVGVQFTPFGEGKRYNSFETMKELEQLYSSYNKLNSRS